MPSMVGYNKATDAFRREIDGPPPHEYVFTAEEAGVAMTEDELQQTVQGLLTDAIQYTEERSTAREKAAKYYAGEPFGNEEDGRSTVVLTPFRDAVKRILPSIVRVFFGGERYMEFRPRGPQTVEMAEQQTTYVSDIVMQEDNPGFVEVLAAFKDALIKRLGIMTWWHEEQVEYTLPKEQHALSQDALAALRQEEGVQVLKEWASDEGEGLTDIRFVRKHTRERERFAAVPPEQWIESRNARNIEEADLVGRRMEKTTAELLGMGYGMKTIRLYGGRSGAIEQNVEEQQRQGQSGPAQPTEAVPEPAMMDRHDYVEVWITLPYKTDKTASGLFKVCLLGPNNEVVNVEPADERPFAVFVPDPEPHTASRGQGPADWTMDLQEIMSSIAREMNNSLSLAINNRLGVVEGEVNIDDVNNPTIGGPIRMTKPGMIQEIEHSFVGRAGLEVLSFYNEMVTQRVGVEAGSAGLDIDALQSTTKSGVDAAVAMAQLQVEMIARVFAEIGMKRLMRGLRRLVFEHPQPDRQIRMHGTWIPVDPKTWDLGLDVGVNVALGAGLVMQRLGVIAQNAAKQELILQNQGLDNPLVGPTELYNSYARLLRLGGIEDVASFWKQPDPNWKPAPQPPDQAGQAAVMIAQAELKKAENDLEYKRQKNALDAQQTKIEEERRALDLELKREEIHLTDERERDKIEADIALRTAIANAQYQIKVDTAEIQADLEKARMEADNSSTSRRKKRRVKLERDPETDKLVAMDITEEGED